jgi:tetratricopeptide (TPR) repeat protein
VILILEPTKGQNFEHDLELARAYLFLERRQEALGVLLSQYQEHKDERLVKLLNLAGSLFFNQETANLHYEAIQLLRASKFQDAKERIEQALSKEPSHVLLLERLIQTEILLGQSEKAWQHLKQAQALAPYSNELKLLSVRLVLDRAEEGFDPYIGFLPLKSLLLAEEVPCSFWVEALKRSGKTAELKALAETVLKKNPDWSLIMGALLNTQMLNSPMNKRLKAQLEKNLKDKNLFEQRLERQMSRTSQWWVGYIRYESLVKQVK